LAPVIGAAKPIFTGRSSAKLASGAAAIMAPTNRASGLSVLLKLMVSPYFDSSRL
jgi:hypothetical protein